MKFKIIIPNFIKNLNDLDYFEYSLGWFEICHKELKISMFKKNLCMVFLSLENLTAHIEESENNNSEKIKWIGEDNGQSFTICVTKHNTIIKKDTIKIKFKTKKLKKAISKGIAKLTLLMQDEQPDIVYKKLFYELNDTAKKLLL